MRLLDVFVRNMYENVAPDRGRQAGTVVERQCTQKNSRADGCDMWHANASTPQRQPLPLCLLPHDDEGSYHKHGADLSFFLECERGGGG